MLHQKLLKPASIVIIGGSNNLTSPQGKVVKNLKESNFKGQIYVVNPKEDEVQGIKCYRDLTDLPNVDTAIISIASKFILETVKSLAYQKGTKGFVVFSAGFSELGTAEGHNLEIELVKIINEVGGSLIGPNCIGLLTPDYNGAFTQPVPTLDPNGCDFVSGSGATAVFILESAIQTGLRFANIFTVGNSAQIGVEEVIKYWDDNFDEKSPKIKLIYMENIDKPQLLLKHAASLIQKGCRIAAIKSGTSEAGSRAASSHTGALASSDSAVDALFNKAGIIRCAGREELISVATVLSYPPLQGKKIAIITHAGGPAVMLTDALSNNGLTIPAIQGEKANELLAKLFHGSTVGNPIDFLATGTAEQLGHIIDYCEKEFDQIDGMAVIFGTPGLVEVYDAYEVIAKKVKSCKKPIFPILPSIKTAKAEILSFTDRGFAFFPDEVHFGKALAKVVNTPSPDLAVIEPAIDKEKIRAVIDNSTDGYLKPAQVLELLDGAKIKRAKEFTVDRLTEALSVVDQIGFPVVMKVVGPLHKSDVGGVVLNVKTKEAVSNNFQELMSITDAKGVLIQPMLKGFELFAGVKYEEKFGHLILCGLGGIYIEVFKDTQTALAPLSKQRATTMVRQLKSYKIIEGVRNQEGCNEEEFIETICKLSALTQAAPEIVELDLNPLLGSKEQVIAVDARIKISRDHLKK